MVRVRVRVRVLVRHIDVSVEVRLLESVVCVAIRPDMLQSSL